MRGVNPTSPPTARDECFLLFCRKYDRQHRGNYQRPDDDDERNERIDLDAADFLRGESNVVQIGRSRE
jgi:hypothetical protein